MSRPSSAALAAVVLLLAGCGGDDQPASTGASTPPAATAVTAPPGTTPTTASTTRTTSAPAATVTLSAPRNGDQYLEGSDARARYKCAHASSCEGAVTRAGGRSQPVKSGGRLPTEPGKYTFVVTAGQTAKATAQYDVVHVPGGGGGGDTQLPPGTPEGGP
jgi:hypothetical protein